MKYNIKLYDVFDYIEKDDEIKKVYKEVETYEDNNKGWAFHNYNHVKNVMNIANKILIELKCSEDIIISSKIACILHDTGARFGKENHAMLSYEYAKEYFTKHNWNFKNKDIILNAIKNHSNASYKGNIIETSLIFADKLDVNKNRITKEGTKVIGNRQFSHVNDIKISINKNLLIVNFITDNLIDIKELNEYYFTKKIFNSVDAFATINNLKYKILIDDKEWNL